MSATEEFSNTKHLPVLLRSTLDYLDPKGGERYLDLTAGYAGHADAVLERTLSYQMATLVDRDQMAVDYLRQHYKSRGLQKIEIVHSDFYSAAVQLVAEGRQFDLILADLGVSSPHLDNAERGFSFANDGPLDMRMDSRQPLTAQQIVNDYDEAALVSILREYGQEPYAARIARAIVRARPLTSTGQLAAVVKKSYGARGFKSKVHPATKTFQALRIAVNNELELLKQAVPLWVDLLAPGGRIVVISFHSLEDRIVKQTLASYAGNRYDAVLQLLVKSPVVAGHTELVKNPRARSAKLRAAAKIKIERGSSNAYPGKKPLQSV